LRSHGPLCRRGRGADLGYPVGRRTPAGDRRARCRPPGRAARPTARARRKPVTPPFFSIGHSDRSLAAFISLLGEARIELVADIRKMPASRANPQFNAQALQDGLAQVGISYEHMAALGGLRGKAPASGDLNGLWTNRSFRNYAD